MGKIDVYDKIAFENQKNIERMGHHKFFYINLHLKDGLGMNSLP